MYDVIYNGRTSYVSNNFCCRIRPERLLFDAERDLLAMAEFSVCPSDRDFGPVWPKL